jgi:ferritin-like protein
MAHEGYHEPIEKLSPATRDLHRAILSVMEELEAVDWYQQRADATDDPQLRAILVHNRDEEKEHAAMTLEWIRRMDPKFDEMLRKYLFTSGDITAVELAGKKRESDPIAAPTPRAISVSSLRGRRDHR